MLRDCNRDLEEIMRCRYCYKYSIQKNSKFWFCKPCKPPHELVYAKQEDFPYWPAKVNFKPIISYRYLVINSIELHNIILGFENRR